MFSKVSIPLDILDVQVLDIKTSKRGDYVITVESELEKAPCHRCGREISKFHSHDRAITLRHLPILGHQVYICLRPKRYECPHCSSKKHRKISTQQLVWYRPKSPHTKAYEEQVLLQLVNSTIQDVALKEKLGYEAVVVVDRYHVAKKYRDCADNLRKQELKRLKTELPKDEYDTIKGAMWPFRKNKADLKPQEAELLDRLFDYAPSLKLAYDCREKLTAIFEKDLTKTQATQAIKEWRQAVETSQLTCFDPFLTTLDTYLDEITNYFLHRDSSGFVEGVNNKIKVLKRRCYRLLNLDHLFQRLFLDLEGYALFA